MNIHHEKLKQFAQDIFAKAGCQPPEDEQIARHLVASNLAGHDSHGVIRIPRYLHFLREGMVRSNRNVSVVLESDVITVLDADGGFGQSMGEQAMQRGIEKALNHGVSVMALRNSGHLGRIGEWAEMGTAAGLVSLRWVNSSGFAMLVAPFGGMQRRLSVNPISVGIPVEGGDPIVLDISTGAIAEGKVRVALNKGEQLPPGCVIDSSGRETVNPEDFYADPPGSILTFGSHKGYGLSVITEVLAGVLTGSGCCDPEAPALINGMLTILLDPQKFAQDTGFADGVKHMIDYVKSARTIDPDGEILMPGELEFRTRARRMEEGIELDDRTWSDLVDAAESLGVEVGND
ncbi:MAG: malate/lactate/ureidoglycolate dehydrogenase [Planctomycetaceae bacterium]|nr:malate/lactate/ureidoglycolate dehydrogenase [Planctomycetaceae bacterium]